MYVLLRVLTTGPLFIFLPRWDPNVVSHRGSVMEAVSMYQSVVTVLHVKACFPKQGAIAPTKVASGLLVPKKALRLPHLCSTRQSGQLFP